MLATAVSGALPCLRVGQYTRQKDDGEEAWLGVNGAEGAAADCRVAVIGHGAIGEQVIDALSGGGIPGAVLSGVIVRSQRGRERAGRYALSVREAIADADLVVECAGVDAVREYGPQVLEAGCDLLVSSVGALADASLRDALFTLGPGRCRLSEGAIGGLDLLAAAARNGGLERVQLTTTKRTSTLVQAWMGQHEVERLGRASEVQELFQGGVDEAIERFPRSLNVGVALAAATGLWEKTRIRLLGDPQTDVTTHEIEASGASGEYRFSITNRPLAKNPASSAVVAQAILHAVSKYARPSGTLL